MAPLKTCSPPSPPHGQPSPAPLLSQPRTTFASSSIPLYQLRLQDATTVQHCLQNANSSTQESPVVMASPLGQAGWGSVPLSQHTCCSPWLQALKKALGRPALPTSTCTEDTTMPQRQMGWGIQSYPPVHPLHVTTEPHRQLAWGQLHPLTCGQWSWPNHNEGSQSHRIPLQLLAVVNSRHCVTGPWRCILHKVRLSRVGFIAYIPEKLKGTQDAEKLGRTVYCVSTTTS